MRVLLFTGKGGVGKTTVAAATAAQCAQDGLRTIVLSTDPAHSLADVFDAPLGDQPEPVAERLWGQQLNARLRFEEAWNDIRSYLVDVLDWAGADAVEAEELAVVPGLDEVFALADIKAFATSGDYDVVWSTVLRLRRPSASCRCPTCSAGTWKRSSTPNVG